jgi:peptidoglycan/xylan/chitin deacetylase (PgdA/CDA1 family)
MTQVAVLSYHKIGEPPADGWDSWYYVPAHTLEAQLGFLVEGGWQPIDHNSLLAGLDHPECLPERSALVTFDDAYHSLAEYAWPVLARTGFPCVVFVPTAFIGRTNLFDDGEEPTESISTWPDLREWASDGVSVQSHGVRHRPMSGIPPNEQRFELFQSRSQLQAGLGLDVELFAFPYGDEGDQPSAMTTLVKDVGYRAAFLYGGGPFDPAHADRYRLPRLAMGPDTDLEVVLR